MTFDKYIKAYWLAITIGLICAGISAAIVHEFASRTAGTVVGLIVGRDCRRNQRQKGGAGIEGRDGEVEEEQ